MADETVTATAPETAGTTGTQEASGETPAQAAQTLLGSEDAAGAAAKAQEAAPAPEGEAAPETYNFKLQEGFTLDDAGQKELDSLFGGMKLTASQAQSLVDEYMSRVSKLGEQSKAARAAESSEWARQAGRDPEYGGKAFAENLGYANAAMKQFATPGLRRLLDSTGLGNHPEMVRLMVRVGKAMREDRFVAGSQAGRDEDLAELMYPSMAGKKR